MQALGFADAILFGLPKSSSKRLKFSFKTPFTKINKFKTNGPHNEKVFLLREYYKIHCKKELERALKRHQNNDPWGQKEVLDAADKCMKIAYAIGYYALKDVGTFSQYLGNNRRSAEGLEKSYFKRLDECPLIYKFIRINLIRAGHELTYGHPIINPHWTILFNDLTKRLISQISQNRSLVNHLRWAWNDHSSLDLHLPLSSFNPPAPSAALSP